MQADAFQGVLAYSIDEAVHLSRAGIDDILIAYPTASSRQIDALIQLQQAGKTVIPMTDRLEHLNLISARAVALGVESVRIAVDLDVSTRFPGIYFGVRRSWISSTARLASYLRHLKSLPRLRLDGVMGYEAQIAGVADSGPLIRLLKCISNRILIRRRTRWVQMIRDAGHTLRFVNGGGTGSLETSRQDPSLTELAAGSGFFAPTVFDRYSRFHHLPAAGFVLEVSRKPENDIVTCYSGGYIASGTPGSTKLPTPVFPKGLRLLKHEGAGEVQTPLQGAAARELQIGDQILFRHAKAGELCERFNELHLIRDGKIVETVTTYRGEGLFFG